MGPLLGAPPLQLFLDDPERLPHHAGVLASAYGSSVSIGRGGVVLYVVVLYNPEGLLELGGAFSKGALVHVSDGVLSPSIHNTAGFV